jgi:hypothetical protein
MNLESELKAVLRRVDPPEGFAEWVMARVGPASAGRLKPARTRRALAAAGLIAIALGGWGMHATLRARNELLTAMRIASEKVAHAQQEVNRR